MQDYIRSLQIWNCEMEKYDLLNKFGREFKGQIISECPYEIIVYPKRPTKKFPRFLPQPLRRGQIKKINAPYYTNQGLFNIIGLIKLLI